MLICSQHHFSEITILTKNRVLERARGKNFADIIIEGQVEDEMNTMRHLP